MTDFKIDFNNCDVEIGKMFDIHDNQNVNLYAMPPAQSSPGHDESECGQGKRGAKVTEFADYIVNSGETDEVMNVIRQNIKPGNVKQSALVVLGGIEAGKISRDVSSPSIKKEFGIKMKPYLTKYREYKDGRNPYFSAEELKPYKDLFGKE